MGIPTAIGLRNAFITVAERDLMLRRPLTKRLVNHARDDDITERHAADLDRRATPRARSARGRPHRSPDERRMLMQSSPDRGFKLAAATPQKTIARFLDVDELTRLERAFDALTVGIQRRKINWVVDCDIHAFFDNVSRDWLIRFLEHRIADKRVIRLIIKWLNAGVTEAGEWRDNLRGTPQGSVISPILANIYLHYVLDLWFQKKWRSHEVRRDAIIARYAADVVVGFQHKRDAERFLDAAKERLGRYELAVHPDKTRLIEFGRSAMNDRRQRGEGRPETFDFLGFTHYCARTRRGYFQVDAGRSRNG